MGGLWGGGGKMEEGARKEKTIAILTTWASLSKIPEVGNRRRKKKICHSIMVGGAQFKTFPERLPESQGHQYWR